MTIKVLFILISLIHFSTLQKLLLFNNHFLYIRLQFKIVNRNVLKGKSLIFLDLLRLRYFTTFSSL